MKVQLSQNIQCKSCDLQMRARCCVSYALVGNKLFAVGYAMQRIIDQSRWLIGAFARQVDDLFGGTSLVRVSVFLALLGPNMLPRWNCAETMAKFSCSALGYRIILAGDSHIREVKFVRLWSLHCSEVSLLEYYCFAGFSGPRKTMTSWVMAESVHSGMLVLVVLLWALQRVHTPEVKMNGYVHSFYFVCRNRGRYVVDIPSIAQFET